MSSLNDHDHVVRYCSPRTINRHGNPTFLAFKLRSSEEYLSVNWLEYFMEPNHIVAIAKIRKVIDLKLKRNGKFSILNVLEIINAGHAVNPELELQIKHHPQDTHESHAGIFGYTENDLEITVELAHLAKQCELYPAIE